MFSIFFSFFTGKVDWIITFLKIGDERTAKNAVGKSTIPIKKYYFYLHK